MEGNCICAVYWAHTGYRLLFWGRKAWGRKFCKWEDKYCCAQEENSKKHTACGGGEVSRTLGWGIVIIGWGTCGHIILILTFYCFVTLWNYITLTEIIFNCWKIKILFRKSKWIQHRILIISSGDRKALLFFFFFLICLCIFEYLSIKIIIGVKTSSQSFQWTRWPFTSPVVLSHQ